VTNEELVALRRTHPGTIKVLTNGYENGYDDVGKPRLAWVVRVSPEEDYFGEYDDANEDDEGAFQALIIPRVKEPK
jgi:hypothetical protein